MKKILAMFLALGMVASLAACGGSGSGSASGVSTSSAASASSSAALQVDTTSEWNVTRPEGLPADFPNQEITYVYPFGTGSMQDVYFRVLAEKVKQMEGWKCSMVVQQKEGASGDIGWNYAINADNDGYTLFFAPTAQQITAIGMDKSYTADNMEYIFNMMTDPGAIGVAIDSPYNTLEDLINAAKENPGTRSIGITSTSGSEGLAVTQLEKASGAKFSPVPFDGETEVLTAVAGGHCDAFCLNVGDCLTFLEEGTIKLLAVGTEVRYERYPDVPTYQECGFDVVQANSRAIAAPAGTDPAIIQYLSDCFVAAANSPDVKEQMSVMDVPYDPMDYITCQKTFMDYYDAYTALWKADPWM